jgi:hypothetical protein
LFVPLEIFWGRGDAESSHGRHAHGSMLLRRSDFNPSQSNVTVSMKNTISDAKKYR